MNILLKSWRSRYMLNCLATLILLSLFLPHTLYAATAVSLGAAESFSVLAALSMTAAGAGTTVTGNLGLSPGLAVSRTGPWTVGGSEYFGTGGLSQTAQSDALTAFNALAGQSSNGAWSVNPWSPAPGVWSVPVDTTFTGTITLNGDADDVWVFQVGRDLTFSGTIVLAGTAQPCNIFWQVGRDVTIATGSVFKGTLIASRDITVVSGATIDGRVISLNGALTTDGNTISGPSCAAPLPTSTPSPSPSPSPNSVQITTTSQESNTQSSINAGGTDTQLQGYIAPTIIGSHRLDADSITLNWGPYSGIDTFIVQYGLTNGAWLYSTNINGFTATLNDLPPNQPIWVHVAVRDSRTISQYGEAKFIGAPALPSTGYYPYTELFSTPIRIPQPLFSSFRTLSLVPTTTVSSVPRRLIIPAIAVAAPIESVGVNVDGVMELPSDPLNVAWLRQGTSPGVKGSAVIAGHLNDIDGSDAVFRDLNTLQSGDIITVENNLGNTTTFVVRALRLYDAGYADEVFSTNDDSHLNLITCDGVWDPQTHSYSKRLVVFADIVHKRDEATPFSVLN